MSEPTMIRVKDGGFVSLERGPEETSALAGLRRRDAETAITWSPNQPSPQLPKTWLLWTSTSVE